MLSAPHNSTRPSPCSCGHLPLLLLLFPADTLLHILTVEEMMLYTAELKRPRSEPLASKKAAVDTLLEKLGLTPCR